MLGRFRFQNFPKKVLQKVGNGDSSVWGTPTKTQSVAVWLWILFTDFHQIFSLLLFVLTFPLGPSPSPTSPSPMPLLSSIPTFLFHFCPKKKMLGGQDGRLSLSTQDHNYHFSPWLSPFTTTIIIQRVRQEDYVSEVTNAIVKPDMGSSVPGVRNQVNVDSVRVQYVRKELRREDIN